MWILDNPIMRYAWGSPTAIPNYLGRSTDGDPVAEMWFGAHPKASSVLRSFQGANMPLDKAIETHPELLGDDVRERFGCRLPFLVKLLAANLPLSLQVHPEQPLAERGFQHEEHTKLSINDPLRTYKDPQHKPEAMIALDSTETLIGFRTTENAASLLDALQLPWAECVRARLDDTNMVPALESLLNAELWRTEREAVLSRCLELEGQARAFDLVRLLDAHFPGDSGAASALLLNDVSYGPGEALFIPAGELHSHISGFGMEVMAASDNVIRAGLTQKHVDQQALFNAVQPHATKPQIIHLSDSEVHFPVDEFTITALKSGDSVLSWGPKVVLSLGESKLEGIDLRRGEAVFIPNGEGPSVTEGKLYSIGVRKS